MLRSRTSKFRSEIKVITSHDPPVTNNDAVSFLIQIHGGVCEQWSLLNNLGDVVISTFGYILYVGTLSKMTDFAHPHLDTHILTHSHTFFFHICCHTFFPHICCTHNFSTVIVGGRHRWGRLGNSSISTMPSTYSCLHNKESVLNNGPGVEGSHANTPFKDENSSRLVGA